MSDIAGFTPEQGRALWIDYQRRMAANPQIRDNFPLRRTIDEVSPHRVLIKNTESEELPAYGCVEVIGTSEVGERTVIDVRKPTRTDGEYLFVSQYAIPEAGSSPEALGVGWAYRYGVVRMLGAPPSSDPARYRPIVDSYEVEEGEGPFVVYGEDTVVEGALVGRIVGKGSSAQIIRFLFEDNASSSSSSSLPSSSSSGEEFCVLDIPPIEDIIAKVVAPACGSEFPPDMDDDGNIGLVDHLGLLVDRKPEDLVGRQGIAVRLKASDDSGPGGVGPCNCWVASGPLSLNAEMTGAGWQLIADAPNGLWVICAETAPAVGTGISTPVRGNPTDTHPAYNIDANLVPSCCNCGPVASSNVECEWVIVYIDFHRWVTVITDFTVEDNQIRIRRKNVKVWDDCRLPDEIITGADCPTESSSSSSGSV